MNIKLIPVDYVVEHARRFRTAVEAMPLRSLLEEWFTSNHHEAEGYATLRDFDDLFPSVAQQVGLDGEASQEPVVLDSCVLSRYRNNQTEARMLVAIIHEIHRRMNIPKSESRKAKRPEDVRQDNWTWPYVMRVMKYNNIIAEDTRKSVFGLMIEQVLGDKVRPNSIRRDNYGDYNIVKKGDYDLKEEDKDIIREITALFVPLIKRKKDEKLPRR